MYDKRKEQALGLVAGTLSKPGSSTLVGSALMTFDASGGQVGVTPGHVW